LSLLLVGLLACRSGTDPAPPAADDTSTPTVPGDALVRFDGEPPKNVLMISIDTFRRDHVGRFGDLGLSPFLDQLMDEGVVAERHQQCSNWTWHSTSCTLMGRAPETIGHMPRLDPGTRVPIPDGQTTLATVLADNGFATVLLSPNMWLGPEWGNAQGYQVINPQGGNSAAALLDRGSLLVDDAMADAGADRWFLHVHLMEPHAPYVPPTEFRVGEDELPPLPISIDQQGAHYDAIALWPDLSDEDRDLLAAHLGVRYRGEVRWMDHMLAQVWELLEERGVLDDTLVVFWTDHGEAFWEHGVQTHAHFLFGEENDALLWFWAKGLEPASWTEPTHGTDMLPTVLDALQLTSPVELPGYPLGAAPQQRTLHASTYTRQGVLQTASAGDWRLHYRWEDGQVRLYDRSTDPLERTDLLLEDPTHPEAPPLWEAMGERTELIDPLVEGFTPFPSILDNR